MYIVHNNVYVLVGTAKYQYKLLPPEEASWATQYQRCKLPMNKIALKKM